MDSVAEQVEEAIKQRIDKALKELEKRDKAQKEEMSGMRENLGSIKKPFELAQKTWEEKESKEKIRLEEIEKKKQEEKEKKDALEKKKEQDKAEKAKKEEENKKALEEKEKKVKESKEKDEKPTHPAPKKDPKDADEKKVGHDHQRILLKLQHQQRKSQLPPRKTRNLR